MYPKVDFPKKVTDKWLNQAFIPLNEYLARMFPEEASKMMAYMTFMCNENQRFFYRNSMTKDAIVLDQSGQLVSCGKEALRYEFEWPEGTKVDRLPIEQRFIHPNVTRWMTKQLSKKAAKKYGEEVSIFLQELWGPIVNYDFEDLQVGYPLPGARVRFCLYLYPAEFSKLIAIQFVGDEIVEKRCSFVQYRDYQKRERELSYEGWQVITIIREFLDRDFDQFRLYLTKAIEQAEPRDDQEYVLTEAGRRQANRD